MDNSCRYGKNRIAALLAAVLCGLAAFSGCAENIEPKSTDVTVTTQQTTAVTTTTTAAVTTVSETVTSAETEPAPEPEPEELAETAPAETTAAETAPAPGSTRNKEVYETAQHIDGLALEASKTAGVYEIKGMLEEAPDIEYLNGVALAFSPAVDAKNAEESSVAESADGTDYAEDNGSTEESSVAESADSTDYAEDNGSAEESSVAESTDSTDNAEDNGGTEESSVAESTDSTDNAEDNGGTEESSVAESADGTDYAEDNGSTEESSVAESTDSTDDPDKLPDYRIRVYDLAQGLLLGETDSLTTGYYPYNRDTCGAFVGGFYSCLGQKIRLMDIGMNVTDEFELPAKKCSKVWLTDSGRYILYNSNRSSSRLYDTVKHAEIGLTMNVKAACVISRGSDSFDILNANGQRFRITAAGEVIPFGTLSVPDYYCGSMDLLEGRVIEVVPGGLCVRRPDSGSAKLIDCPPQDIKYVISATERYIVFTDKKDSTHIIDIQTGKVSGAIGSGAFAARGNGSDGSFIFLDDPEHNENYRCMLAVPSEAEYKKAIGIREINTAKDEYLLYFNAALPDSERTSSLLKELRERYNVRVMFSPVSETELYCGYCCKAYTSEKAQILEALRNFLAMSPPGILREAAEGGAETWILISSNIVDDPGQTAYGTAGFASMIGLHPFIALETPASASEKDYITDSERYAYYAKYITDNFSHEFIHILDGKTTEEQTERWKALSPEDSYFGTYESVSGSTDKYVKFGGDFDNKVYFVDKYARINELEDKARTGEHLYYAREGGSETSRGKFARSRSLYGKAAELAAIFRENYPCLETIPKGEWYLEKPLMNSFDELKKKWKESQSDNS